MKTLHTLHTNGIKSLSLKSSITRRFLNSSEINEMSEDFKTLFNLMNSKTYEIMNSLKSGRDYYFNGAKIDISSLSFLVK